MLDFESGRVLTIDTLSVCPEHDILLAVTPRQHHELSFLIVDMLFSMLGVRETWSLRENSAVKIPIIHNSLKTWVPTAEALPR